MARGWGFERPPIWAIVVMVVGAVGLVVGGIYAAGRPRQDPVSQAQLRQMDAHASAVAVSEAAARPQIVAFLGDSYVAGTGASSTATRFTTVLSKMEHWKEVNLGCGGSGYVNPGPYCKKPYPQRIDEVVKAAPTTVVVFGGRNDLPVATASEVQAAAESTFSQLHQALPQARILIVSPVWDDDPEPAGFPAIQQAVKTAASDTGVTYLDIGEPLRGHPGWVISDGAHPNDAGHKAIADAIAAALPSP
ncbi:MAG TPA: SGNH/GDSL hydrolase family protein [Acidimicrobiales bacterium]|nr:SGNH/GDSL hydrolase family protein [Acidimicrobiales bacterium]